MSSHFLHKGTQLFALPILLVAAGLSGCSTLYSPVSASGTSGNWQIQSSVPTLQPFVLAGPMQIQGSQVTATLHTAVDLLIAGPVVSYSGTYSSSTGALTLTSDPTLVGQSTGEVQIALTVPPDPTKGAPGTFNISEPNYDIGPWQAVGSEIPPLIGTYSGTVVSQNGSSSSVPATAVATLTLTQSTTPANAQFPLTGMLQFTSGTCSAGIAITGTIIGTAYTLTSAATGTSTTVTGADTLGGTSLPAAAISFSNGPCNTSSATYTGTLILQ